MNCSHHTVTNLVWLNKAATSTRYRDDIYEANGELSVYDLEAVTSNGSQVAAEPNEETNE